METLALLLFLPALAVGLFAAIFGLGRVLSPGGLGRISRGPWPLQWNLWQMMTGVALAALLLMIVEWGHEGYLLIAVASMIVLAWFVRNWREEFVFLMGLRDDEFPGRHDKLTWSVMLLLLAPVGVWSFRAYRLAHWPEPADVREDVAEEAGGAAAQPA